MRSKLNFLINVSLKRKIATKWFIIANVILGLLVVGITNIDTIINFFGGDFTEKQMIYVVDQTNRTYDLFEKSLETTNETFKEASAGINYELTNYDKTLEEATSLIEKDNKVWVILFEEDENNFIKVKIISESFIDTFDYQILTGAINGAKVEMALVDSNINPEELAKIYAPAQITREYLDETKNNKDENMEMIMSTVFPIIILPFFMLTIFLVQMIGAEVNDEKTTRGMEIIISNVSPETHFFAKVVAGNLFVIIQGLLLLTYGGLGLLIRRLTTTLNPTEGLNDYIGKVMEQLTIAGIGEKLIYIIPLTIILMLVTFIGYSLMAGILASMTTNIEDFQQLQTPIMVVSLLGYYLSMMAGLFEGSLLIKVVSYVPFISAILSPSLLMLGYINIIDVVIAIAVMSATIYILVKYGLKIYKVGILNYSSTDLWKKMFKAIKE